MSFHRRTNEKNLIKVLNFSLKLTYQKMYLIEAGTIMSLLSCLDCKYLSVLYRVSKSVDMRESARSLSACRFNSIVNKRVELFYKTLLNKITSRIKGVVESSIGTARSLGIRLAHLFWM